MRVRNFADNARVTKLALPSGVLILESFYAIEQAYSQWLVIHRQTISGEHGLDGSGQ